MYKNLLGIGVMVFIYGDFVAGFYKGLVPLWARQIPYTMMKFACFERTVEALYKYVVPKPRADCSKSEQLGVTFVAGRCNSYIYLVSIIQDASVYIFGIQKYFL